MSGALRILLVADVDPDPNTGAAGTEIALADHLDRLGHRVTRVWADRMRHSIRHWNLYHLLEQPRAYRDAIAAEIGRHGDFDVYHVNQPAGWLAAREHQRLHRPGLFVHRSHGFEPRVAAVVRRWRRVYPEDRRPWPRRVASAALAAALARNYAGIVRWADAHVVSCTECAEDLVRRGARPESVHVSAQAATAELLGAPAPAWSGERAQHLLHVGRHVFVKAPMIIAALFERWLSGGPERRATWICEESEHESVRRRLSPAIRGRVHLLGWQPRTALAAVLDRAGIFLFPSFTEGFGKAFLEAMARGLCVVATAQGGARDVIVSGHDGLLAPVGDVEALARHLDALAASPSLAASMSSAARQTAEVYTWERAARSLADFYRNRLVEREASA